MQINSRIEHLMEERGWTVYKLAKQAKLSETTVTNLFKRNNAPTFSTLASICEAFGITLAQFFSEGDDPVVLTEEQKVLLSKWSTLSKEQQKILLDLIANI